MKAKVASAELCKKMKELGLNKPAKYWRSESREDGVLLYVGNGGYPAMMGDETQAWDLPELLAMLPGDYGMGYREGEYRRYWCEKMKTSLHKYLLCESNLSQEEAVAMMVLRLMKEYRIFP